MREDLTAAMERAILSGNTAEVVDLLAHEPRLTGTPIPVARDWGEEMWLGLHLAAERGALEVARLLLETGASVDARTRFRTPMHARETALVIAARCGHGAVAGLLLERHAAVDLLDATHRGALSHAAGGGGASIVVMLLDRGAGIDSADDQDRTPLHWAIAGGHADAALLLIDRGADVNHCCPKEPAGYTPLHRCMSAGGALMSVADRLIAAGADRTLRDPRFNKTAADLRV